MLNAFLMGLGFATGLGLGVLVFSIFLWLAKVLEQLVEKMPIIDHMAEYAYMTDPADPSRMAVIRYMVMSHDKEKQGPN